MEIGLVGRRLTNKTFGSSENGDILFEVTLDGVARKFAMSKEALHDFSESNSTGEALCDEFDRFWNEIKVKLERVVGLENYGFPNALPDFVFHTI